MDSTNIQSKSALFHTDSILLPSSAFCSVTVVICEVTGKLANGEENSYMESEDVTYSICLCTFIKWGSHIAYKAAYESQPSLLFGIKGAFLPQHLAFQLTFFFFFFYWLTCPLPVPASAPNLVSRKHLQSWWWKRCNSGRLTRDKSETVLASKQGSSLQKKIPKLRNIISVTGQYKFGELLAAALLYAKIHIFLSLFVSSAFEFSVPVQDLLRPYILTMMILQSNIQCMNSWWPNPNALSKC